jgi:hypothetical protein
MTNPLKLRTTIKNLMVTHSAIQKSLPLTIWWRSI